MKTRMILAAAVLFFASAVVSNAQSGIDAGYTFSQNKTNILEEEGLYHKSKAMHGFYVGFQEDLRIFSVLYLNTGLYYRYLTKDSGFDFSLPGETAPAEPAFVLQGGDVDHSLVLPIHLKLKFRVSEAVSLFASVGPSLDFGLLSGVKYDVHASDGVNGKIIYNNYSGKINAKGLAPEIKELVSQRLPDDRYRWFDCSMGLTAGVVVGRFFEFRVGYDWGLVNKFRKGTHEGLSCNENLLRVGVGFRF